jgi:hypothetical protein
MKVRIKVFHVGQCFAVGAKVFAVSNRRRVHETRMFPYGFDAQAYRAAELWVREKGHTLKEEEQ